MTNIVLRLLHFSMAFVVAVSVQIWHNTLLSRSNCAVATRHLECVRVLFGSLNAFVGRVCVVYTLCYVRCVIFKHSCHCPCRPYTHSVSPCHWCSSYQDPRSFGTTTPSFTGRICTWACCCTGARAIDFLTHDKAAAYRRKSMSKLVRHLCSDRFRTLQQLLIKQPNTVPAPAVY